MLHILRKYTDGSEEDMSVPEAEAELLGEILDDYTNRRWGRMESEDGDEVVVHFAVRIEPREVTPDPKQIPIFDEDGA